MMAYLLIGIGLLAGIALIVRLVMISPAEFWRTRVRNLRRQGFVMQDEPPPTWERELLITKLGIAALLLGFLLFAVMIVVRI